ncbi:hypothetical protein WP1_027 [Pseudomonas phage WP1]
MVRSWANWTTAPYLPNLSDISPSSPQGHSHRLVHEIEVQTGRLVQWLIITEHVTNHATDTCNRAVRNQRYISSLKHFPDFVQAENFGTAATVKAAARQCVCRWRNRVPLSMKFWRSRPNAQLFLDKGRTLSKACRG